MMCVLAIVGALSVGSLAMYSYAMEKHKINLAIEEIYGFIVSINDLYASSNNYEGISENILISAGVFDKAMPGGQAVNAFEMNMYINNGMIVPTYMYKLHYTIPSDNACQKILLSGMLENLGPNYLEYVAVYYSDTTVGVRINWDASSVYQLPLKVEEAQAVCINTHALLFFPH
ncbi:MAG: hypothetical protein GY804_13660 [Alphaproteobacteria bacterium]|nr:hypothetical protein [Alphaproteobacteria bacterium]